ncbi:PP2C family protein-serine/threonine phosphatase [Streptomyces sp. NPDC093085]|uniref:PP2C family protein-serine/threonine phosphatase n=1 Tax=Streptomyces sp. NPDC093085 TaxID=3155068 RepID=UPI0034345B6A
MTAPNSPKVAGIDSAVTAPPQTPAPREVIPAPPGALIQDRLAAWVSDLTTLHELVERLSRTRTPDAALDELLRAGAALTGAPRGVVILEPADGPGPATTVGLGLSRADIGHLETVPRHASAYGRLLLGGASGTDAGTDADTGAGAGADAGTGTGSTSGSSSASGDGVAEPDLFGDPAVDPRHREVAARLGCGASYAVPLRTEAAAGPGRRQLGVAVWLYDEPGEPAERRRHLVGLYARHAAAHLDRLLEQARTRARAAALAEELRPARLPRLPGVRLAARHRPAPRAARAPYPGPPEDTGAPDAYAELRGGDGWYDALPLPDGALSLAVGSVSGSGPGALAAAARLRAALRAYAVMEGEDPVAVLSDLELLLRITEPARTSTALFAYAEPGPRKIVLAGAGHAPPLIVGARRTEFAETAVSAPLGMLSCWQAPSVDLWLAPGETLLFYTDGLLHRTGAPMDRAFARLHTAAASVPAAARHDPGRIADHVLRTLCPEEDGPSDGPGGTPGDGDIVLLAARFD